MTQSAQDVFDAPSQWRAGAALRLGLRGEERMAAASAGAALPLALDVLERSLALAPGDLLVDVGAGLAGVSAWLAARTGARVLAVEPAIGSVNGARTLFGDHLDLVAAAADAVPVRRGAARGLTYIGVLSLIDDLEPVLREADRMLGAGGRIGISDLVLADGVVERPAGTPNTFRSVMALVTEFAALGFEVVDAAYGDAARPTRWSDVGRRVDDDVRSRHGEDPRFVAWEADGEALGRLISAGSVDLASLVLRR